MTRRISLRVAKSTTAKPLKPLSCAKIQRVDPSGFEKNAIGRMPRSISSVHAGSSDAASITLMVLPAIDPVTAYLLSGVT